MYIYIDIFTVLHGIFSLHIYTEVLKRKIISTISYIATMMENVGLDSYIYHLIYF